MVSDKSINSVIVIGGGSSGCSIAYNLASRGKKVRLIERGSIASGNTGKSSALVRTHYSNELISSMALFFCGPFQERKDNQIHVFRDWHNILNIHVIIKSIASKK